MRSKDNEFAVVKLPRCLVGGGVKVEWGRHSSEHTHRHIVQAHVEEDRTGSQFTYAEKEGVERSKERRNGGKAIGVRGKMGRSRVGGKGTGPNV